MSTRETLRRWLGIKRKTGPHDPNVHDEEILNVLRRELEKEDGDEELTTKEIAGCISIGHDQTHNRLSTLKDEKRVTKRRAGQTDMWALAETEPKTVVNPELGPVVGWCSRARWWASRIHREAKRIAAIGLVFLLIGSTAWITNLTLPLTRWPVVLAWGYTMGVVSGAFLGGAALLRLLAIYTPPLLEYLLLE